MALNFFVFLSCFRIRMSISPSSFFHQNLDGERVLTIWMWSLSPYCSCRNPGLYILTKDLILYLLNSFQWKFYIYGLVFEHSEYVVFSLGHLDLFFMFYVTYAQKLWTAVWEWNPLLCRVCSGSSSLDGNPFLGPLMESCGCCWHLPHYPCPISSSFDSPVLWVLSTLLFCAFSLGQILLCYISYTQAGIQIPI